MIAAKDLVSKDSNCLSDPYVKAKIIPRAEDGKMKYKTKTHRKNLNPEFNETFVIDIKPGDKFKRLLIEVMLNPFNHSFILLTLKDMCGITLLFTRMKVTLKN